MQKSAIHDSKLETVKGLYYGELLSVPVIAKQLGVSQDSTYYFFRKHKIERRPAAEDRAIRFARKPLSFYKQNLDTVELKELAAIGAMLYWGEGYKGSIEKPADTVDFANSDPQMISVFLNFLRTVYRPDEKRFRIYLYCYSDQDVGELIDFWTGRTGIPRSQVIKPYVRSDFREGGRKMRYGLIHIRYSDKKLLLDIKDMIEYYTRKHAPIV